ncbi:MAG: Fe-S cluster assembly protein SufD [Nanoarchaeota archaeon]
MDNTIIQLKEQAAQKFTKLELPTQNHGKGFALSINVDWEKVFREIRKAENPVIIADERVKVCRLSELGEEFISKYAQKLVPAEDKLLALQYSVAADAQVIIIPKNIVIENPIIINTKATAIASAESIIVIAEAGAQATIVENAVSTENVHYKSQILQLYLQSRAKITYCTLHQEKAGTHSFTTKRAEVLQDASVQWFDFAIGKGFTQVQLRSHLREAGAEAQQYQVMIGIESQQGDINSDAYHEHNKTTSVMLAKGILSDKSRAMHRGTIRVEKNAANCQGHQRSDMLLIGEEARCNAIPVLEVENDDVSCSHGTTMGQIDEEQLYYLVSRGLDENLARQMLVMAFVEPIVQKIENETVREEIMELIEQQVK